VNLNNGMNTVYSTHNTDWSLDQSGSQSTHSSQDKDVSTTTTSTSTTTYTPSRFERFLKDRKFFDLQNLRRMNTVDSTVNTAWNEINNA